MRSDVQIRDWSTHATAAVARRRLVLRLRSPACPSVREYRGAFDVIQIPGVGTMLKQTSKTPCNGNTVEGSG